LDHKRYTAYWNCPERDQKALADMGYGADLLIPDGEAQDFFRELIGYYNCVPFNGKNVWTLPPLGGWISNDKVIIPDRRDQAKKSGKNAIRGNEG
jgi:hypothetical protein